jgi:hypothetical protein
VKISTTAIGLALGCLTLIAACTQVKQDAIAQATSQSSTSPTTTLTPAIAQATTPEPTENSDAQQLSPQQLAALQSVGLKIALPAYIPEGFSLDKVRVTADRNARFGGLDYFVIYRGSDRDSNQDLCFAIEATSGGIGDIPAGEKSFPVNSTVFGQTSLEYGSFGSSNPPSFLSGWMGPESGPFYRFVGAGVDSDIARCNNISPDEAVRVLESLQYLKS